MKLGCRMGAALAVFLAVSVSMGLVRAQEPNGPVGSWKTIDDKTGRDRSVIRIEATNGVLTGRVQRSLDPNDPPGAKCTKCTGPRKDQPIIGMAILTGLKADGDGRHWSGGEIVDPDSGEIYRVKIAISPDGKTMEVRGFIGISLFGRSQTWIRVP